LSSGPWDSLRGAAGAATDTGSYRLVGRGVVHQRLEAARRIAAAATHHSELDHDRVLADRGAHHVMRRLRDISGTTLGIPIKRGTRPHEEAESVRHPGLPSVATASVWSD